MWSLVLERFAQRVLWIGSLVLLLPLLTGLLARLPIFFGPDPDDNRGQHQPKTPLLEAESFVLPSDDPDESVDEG